ncbi:MAG: hypothetical protein NTY35_06025 [Planctomycetota bacterium]|nr:hypothetical protein [Planctomycetota bacterium]
MVHSREHPASDRPRRTAWLATVVLAPLACGWLASGSCSVSACYEECDPCFQACKCSGVCQNPVAGEQGLRIVAHESRILAAEDDRFVRVLDVVVGPSLEFASGNERSDRDRSVDLARLAEFAREILVVNAEVFTSVRDPDWRLDAVHAFSACSVAQFHLEPGRSTARRANSVSLLFDAHGRLLEATHVVDRGSD